MQHVKPLTAQASVSYCDMIARERGAEARVATVFISHCWRYDFLAVVSSLKLHFSGMDQAHDTVIWFDIFSINENDSKNHDFAWWSTTFKVAIRNI